MVTFLHAVVWVLKSLWYGAASVAGLVLLAVIVAAITDRALDRTAALLGFLWAHRWYCLATVPILGAVGKFQHERQETRG